MQIFEMDPVLFDIYNIRNIESINLWDLHSSTDGKLLVLPALMVNYDGGKYLNLCVKDKFFVEYVRKVRQVYNDEKNNILEDSLTDPFKLRQSIRIDERTKKVLESEELEVISENYSFYEGKDSYDNSLLFQIDKVKMFMPLIKYHLCKLFGITDKVISFDDEINGYRNNYAVFGKVNGVDTNITLMFNYIDDTICEVSITGLTKERVPVMMRVEFKKDSIDIFTGINPFNLFSSSSYMITDGVVKEITTVKRNDVAIHYENRDLEETELEYDNVANLDCDTKLKWFKLPWGAYYGIDTKVIDVSEVEKIVEIQNMYLNVANNGFTRNEYYSKTYLRNRTVSVSSEEVVLDFSRQCMCGLLIDGLDGVYQIETKFITEGSNGYYEGKLKDRHFYHLVVSNDVKGIKRENLVSVGRENNILGGVDLLNKTRVLSLVKGE